MRVIDLILPCYNPTPGWSENLIYRFEELKRLTPDSLRVLIVDDGSTSTTFNAEIQNVLTRVPGSDFISYSQNRGKGHAIRTGFEASQSSLVLFTDIDLPYTNDSILRVIDELTSPSSPAIVAGQRTSGYYESIPTDRKVISLALRKVFIATLNLPVNDTQCGLKGFSAEGKKLVAKSRIDRFLFDLEVLTLSVAYKAKVTPVKVFLDPAARISSMRLRTLIVESINLLRIIGILAAYRLPFLRKQLC